MLLAAGVLLLPGLGLLAASSREPLARPCPPACAAGPGAPAALGEELALVLGDELALALGEGLAPGVLLDEGVGEVAGLVEWEAVEVLFPTSST